MSAILDLINFMKEEYEQRSSGFLIPRLRRPGTPPETETPPETDEAKAYREKLEGISRELEDETALAEAARGGRFKGHVEAYQREQDKPKDWKEDVSQTVSSLPSASVGALGSAAKLATEYGGPAATAAAQQGSQMPQGPVQSSPGGVGTGKASAFARQKGGQAPRLRGKVPSLSTQVRFQNPKPPTTSQPKINVPQPMPVGQKMLKTSSLDKLLKAVDDGYNTKGERREAKQQKARKMKVTGKGVQTLQQILVDRAKKLEDKE